MIKDDRKILPINFREIGAAALTVKQARLFRSGSLAQINDVAALSLKNLGIVYNIDLRSNTEVNKSGFPVVLKKYGIEWRHFPIEHYDEKFKTILLPTVNDYIEYYKEMINISAKKIVEIFAFLSTKNIGGIVINCYSGKDRTGILSYLLLSILEINPSIIYHDYLLSGKYLLKAADKFAENWKKRQLTMYEYLPRLQPKVECLQELHKYIGLTYHNPENFLLINGLSSHALHQVRENFMSDYI